MTIRIHWLNRIAVAVLWLAITAGVAFLVARYAVDENVTDVTAPLPPIAASERETVTLTQQTIAPIVSSDGSVFQDGDQWLLEAPAAPADVAYRLLDPPVAVRALIDGGPAGFDCTWAGLGQGPDGGVTMRCAIPADVRVAAGMTGTMVLQMGEPVTAMALPVQAVVGSDGQGQVVVVNEAGETELRTVDLGASDSFWIEVTGGLEPGESVLAAPTQADFAQAGQ
jgi:hypothetical protein